MQPVCTKRFDRLNASGVANDAISLTLARGEVLAAGRNGAGVHADVHPVPGTTWPTKATSRFSAPTVWPRAALAAALAWCQHFTLATTSGAGQVAGQRTNVAAHARAPPRDRSLSVGQQFGLLVHLRQGGPVGGRAPARRDPEGAVPGRASSSWTNPPPCSPLRRARRCSTPWRRWWRRAFHHLHQPQVGREEAALHSHRVVVLRRRLRWPRRPPTPSEGQLAQWMVSHAIEAARAPPRQDVVAESHLTLDQRRTAPTGVTG